MCILLQIYATIPVASTMAERSFSRLKLIKSHLRSTMREDRLRGLGLLSVERQLAETTDFTSAIDTFANMRSQRKTL